jgi:hypothetical protein
MIYMKNFMISYKLNENYIKYFLLVKLLFVKYSLYKLQNILL